MTRHTAQGQKAQQRAQMEASLDAIGIRLEEAQLRIDDPAERYGGTVADATLLDALASVLVVLRTLARRLDALEAIHPASLADPQTPTLDDTTSQPAAPILDVTQ